MHILIIKPGLRGARLLSIFQGCRVIPQGVYKDFNGDGVIELTDDSVHQVKIVVKDAYGNTSTLEFKIKKGLIKETG